MQREAAVLFMALVLIVSGATGTALRAHREGAPGRLAQLFLGLACGAVGAIVAVTPYADVVPDRFEVALLIGLGCLLVLLLGVAVLRRVTASRRRARRRARRRRRRRMGATTPSVPQVSAALVKLSNSHERSDPIAGPQQPGPAPQA